MSKKRAFYTRVLVVCLAFFKLISASASSDSNLKKFQAEAGSIIQSVYGPETCGTMLVVRDGVTLFEKSLGLADLSWDAKNDSQTRYRIASTTKTFTAILTLQAMEEGKLQLNDPLSTYFPDVAQWSKITVHHLLTHTSGIHQLTAFDGFKDWLGKSLTKSDLLEKIKSSKLGTLGTYEYSEANFTLLGIILERVSGKDFAVLLQEGILNRVKMGDTGIASDETVVPRLATGYYSRDGESVFRISRYLGGGLLSLTIVPSAGDMYGTATDLIKLSSGLRSNQLISKSSFDAMTKSYISVRDETGTMEGVGYGINRARWSGLDVAVRVGSWRGQTTYFSHFIDKPITIVVIFNYDRNTQISPKIIPMKLTESLVRHNLD